MPTNADSLNLTGIHQRAHMMDPIAALQKKLQHILIQNWCADGGMTRLDIRTASAVLLLLEAWPQADGSLPISLVLNKRSQHVKQPGDICCPGGGIKPRLDPWLGRLLHLPGLPLASWRSSCRPNSASRFTAFQDIRLILAAGLRESFEEMGLNPFRTRLLGPLPAQPLQMFRRRIYPLAVWISPPSHFRLNREVEKIVRIPLPELLDPTRYARYCLNLGQTRPERSGWHSFPCFVIRTASDRQTSDRELLWGATFRIVMSFLKLSFGFIPPPLSTLPAITGELSPCYLAGSKNEPSRKI